MNTRKRTLERFYRKHKKPDLILKEITMPDLCRAFEEAGITAKVASDAFQEFGEKAAIIVGEEGEA